VGERERARERESERARQRKRESERESVCEREGWWLEGGGESERVSEREIYREMHNVALPTRD
jgi:hypothetical protein